MYTRIEGQVRRYCYLHREADAKISGHPATVVEQEDGPLSVQKVGCDQVKEDNMEQEDFLIYLKAYGGERF